MLARTTLGKETGGVVAREAARMPSNESLEREDRRLEGSRASHSRLREQDRYRMSVW